MMRVVSRPLTILPASHRKMKLVFAFLLLVTLSGAVCGQEAKQRATVEGIVTKDPDSQPVKKALIELIADNQLEAGNYTTITAADGTFRIEDIPPGRYHLFAERTGLLDTDRQRRRSDGQILTLSGGQELKDLHLRLQAAAVIRGRISDEDGDPLPNAEVTALRQTYVAGHKHWEQAGADRSNDLGEYRIANLPAGNVYISVNPPPDFKSLIENAGTVADRRNPKPDRPSQTYQTIFYPGTADRGQAAPIELHAGDEFPADFTLTPSPSLSIRGAVVNLPPRASATIMLQSRDLSLILNGAEMRKDGTFVIHDVSPGSYTIIATVEGTSVPMTARQSLQLGSASVEGVRLAPQPGTTVRGRVRVEGKNGAARFDPQRIFLSLQSVDPEQDEAMLAGRETFSSLAHVSPDGSFVWSDVPAGDYYVQLMGDTSANEGWFVKSLTAGGRDVNDSGIAVSGGVASLDLVISANGAVVEGVAIGQKGEPVSNAVVVAVPEVRLRSRSDHYRKTVSDQSGRFTLRGIRPGDYTVFAWQSVDGEAYYNSDFLKVYEERGSALHLSEGDRKSLQVEVIPDAAVNE
ncbi:MAG TPA: carboxypeptidase-like regulatory domain-containing protein [Candidatus Sulfotelmatobacter sp.]|nr:carboxypeptidase-like regulatory domain-containing protein [Candidatus Sulfotelmatobacter sp.]